MHTVTDIDRLAIIDARVAIADLVHTYVLAIRRERPEEAAALFTENGWLEVRDGYPDRVEHSVRALLDGPENVLSYLLPGRNHPRFVPMIHNLMIQVTGDTACASSVLETRVLGTGQSLLGEFSDTLRCVDGKWRFASRTFTRFVDGRSTG